MYDALTSKQVYKSASSHEEAVASIVAEKDEHFDPVIVDMFLIVQNGFRELSVQDADVEHNMLLSPVTTELAQSMADASQDAE